MPDTGIFASSGPGELGPPELAGVGDAPPRASILIVDDLPEKLLVFGTVLEDLGQNLVFVRSGAEALREVLKQEFAVILLDVNMPDIDGFETAGLIRRYKKSAHTPIIFITSYADELQTVRGYSLGAVDFILSPVVPEVLRSKVKVFVELHTMRQRAQAQAEERAARMAAEAAQRVAEHNDRRARFLARASSVLGASLDLAVAERQLIELLLPDTAGVAVLLRTDAQRELGRGLVGSLPAGAAAGTAAALAQLRPQQLPGAVRQAVQQALDRNAPVLLGATALAGFAPAGYGLPGPATLRSAMAERSVAAWVCC